MKSWIYLFDHEDFCDVVDMIETTGTSYIPSIEQGGLGDIVFIATNDYGGRILYMVTVSRTRGFVADNGEVFFDTVAKRGMLIVDALRFTSLREEGLPTLKEGMPLQLTDDIAEKLKRSFVELDDYGDRKATDLKTQIIMDAKV